MPDWADQVVVIVLQTSLRQGSELLQPDNRLDVGWEVPRRFENLAVVPDQRFVIAVQLAHVRSVHLLQDRV